jgi:hypothetical protein
LPDAVIQNRPARETRAFIVQPRLGLDPRELLVRAVEFGRQVSGVVRCLPYRFPQPLARGDKAELHTYQLDCVADFGRARGSVRQGGGRSEELEQGDRSSLCENGKQDVTHEACAPGRIPRFRLRKRLEWVESTPRSLTVAFLPSGYRPAAQRRLQVRELGQTGAFRSTDVPVGAGPPGHVIPRVGSGPIQNVRDLPNHETDRLAEVPRSIRKLDRQPAQQPPLPYSKRRVRGGIRRVGNLEEASAGWIHVRNCSG